MGLSKKQMEMLMKRLDDGENHSEEYYGQYLVGNELDTVICRKQ